MAQDNVVIRFENVSFEYNDQKVILDEANFSVRRNSIVTIIGQNGAGKSTIFKLLLGKLIPTGGKIHLENGATIGIAEQMVPADKIDLTVLDYFKTALPEKEYGIEGDIYKIFKSVNLDVPLDRKVKVLSGGQKARLLLAYALITNPDVLLLDEPTNNLDKEGVNELTIFLMNYEKTCIVISHDSDFLNCFTDGVLNLDVHTHKVEQFVGNYYDVINEIEAKLERDRRQNALLEKSIKDRFLKINKLGGKSIAMSHLARKLRKEIEEDRETAVEIRREDKTIPNFTIPCQEYVGYIAKIKEPIVTELVKGVRLLIKGPNGIGKSTLLRSYLDGKKADINPKIRIGYYSQDFSELDFNQTAYDSILSVNPTALPQEIYEAGARFLLNGDILNTKIESLSEGQKGLLCYARLVMQKPGLLILDEPTNHINFRHIPVITKAIDGFEGPVIFVSHLPEFFEKIKNVREVKLSPL
ncbi:MAG: ABC-F family ATP-binding cassette domain-containing protein [Candidatus Woesebacteria bacterium]|nr:MAG: ABC-F family ATP-binding cassette domain-containing protein [Candidatus Woesebacteria bacterium]